MNDWQDINVEQPNPWEGPRGEPSTSTLTTTNDAAGPSAPANKRKRRACDACRLRQVACQRNPGQEDCLKCIKMAIRCIVSPPKPRTTNKGARIAQAKALYSHENTAMTDTEQMALALVQRSSNQATLPYSPSLPQQSIFALMDSALTKKLILIAVKLKFVSFPLLRWINLEKEYTAAGSLLKMDSASQAVFMGIAAIAARAVSPQELDGQDAPALEDLSKSQMLRQGTTLCMYGKRREAAAITALQGAIRVINETGIFTSPSLKSVSALTMLEMLILVFRDPLRFSKESNQQARPYAATAAAHLRILAEEYALSGIDRGYDFYSTAWTCIIRDALVAVATGRALNYTSSDLQLILGIDETQEIPIPDSAALVQPWTEAKLEGRPLMQLWAVALRQARIFIDKVTQPLAAGKPELDTSVFERVFTCFRKVREVLNGAIMLAQLYSPPIKTPEQVGVLHYCTDFFLVQAHQVLVSKMRPDQLSKTNNAGGGGFMASLSEIDAASPTTSLNGEYLAKLQLLKLRSDEEVFQAGQRMVELFLSMFRSDAPDTVEFFLPGYFTFEGLLAWVDIVVATPYAEEQNGREDYPLQKKLADLRVLREAMALMGWSSASVQPHIEGLSQTILELELIERESISPSTEGTDMSFMDSYLNLASPIPQASLPNPDMASFGVGDIFGDGTFYQPPLGDNGFQSGFDLNAMNEMMSSEWLQNLFKQS